MALVQTMPSSDMAWALLQRFVRRVDGKAAAREVFRLTKKPRLAEELGHHVSREPNQRETETERERERRRKKKNDSRIEERAGGGR